MWLWIDYHCTRMSSSAMTYHLNLFLILKTLDHDVIQELYYYWCRSWHLDDQLLTSQLKSPCTVDCLKCHQGRLLLAFVSGYLISCLTALPLHRTTDLYNNPLMYRHLSFVSCIPCSPFPVCWWSGESLNMALAWAGIKTVGV